MLPIKPYSGWLLLQESVANGAQVRVSVSLNEVHCFIQMYFNKQVSYQESPIIERPIEEPKQEPSQLDAKLHKHFPHLSAESVHACTYSYLKFFDVSQALPCHIRKTKFLLLESFLSAVPFCASTQSASFMTDIYLYYLFTMRYVNPEERNPVLEYSHNTKKKYCIFYFQCL